jgi:hypothetical protein
MASRSGLCSSALDGCRDLAAPNGRTPRTAKKKKKPAWWDTAPPRSHKLHEYSDLVGPGRQRRGTTPRRQGGGHPRARAWTCARRPGSAGARQEAHPAAVLLVVTWVQEASASHAWVRRRAAPALARLAAEQRRRQAASAAASHRLRKLNRLARVSTVFFSRHFALDSSHSDRFLCISS